MSDEKVLMQQRSTPLVRQSDYVEPAESPKRGRLRLHQDFGGQAKKSNGNGNGHTSLHGANAKLLKNPTHIRVEPTPMETGTVLEGVSQKVFLDRYSLKDEKGNPIEKYPEQMWRRLAVAGSRIETPEKQKEWEDKFYSCLEGFKFVPGGRILSGAGTGYDVTYYNCYVLPSPQDSRWGIMHNLSEMIDIMARGGGVGVNLSSLRPRGSRVRKINGFSSGPINWAELYSVATHDVIQQGGTRRGALMLMLWDWHPDVEEFITVKKDLSRINGANLSVCVSDSFMEAVKVDGDWDLVFPDLDDPEYDQKWDGILDSWIKLGKRVIKHKTVKARSVWDLICEAAWASAEPGLVFMERYNKEHSNRYFNTINCVNPCGEEGLPAYGVCNLGSLNLAAFVNEAGELDYDSLAEHARVAVRFNDNMIDGDIYIFDGIRKTQLEGERRVGIGTMGLGDALIKMKIRYGSEESLPVIERIYKTIRDAAFDASSDYAQEKGAFMKFDAEKYMQGKFIQRLPQELQDKIRHQGIRNSVILMQAPTGSTSLVCGVTSGIEPVYEFSFTRRDRLGEHKIYHPLYQDWLALHPGEEVPGYFVSANDLTPEEHVKVQAAVQKYVDASISKTVNAPNSHTIDDVKNLYTLAYELGLKGIAYMRDGSREGVLSREESKVPKVPEVSNVTEPTQQLLVAAQPALLPRPVVLKGATYHIATPVGNAFITINEDEAGNPQELFITVGKAGSDVGALAEGLGRVISIMLRSTSYSSPIDKISKITDQLRGIGGRRSVGFGENRVLSLPDAVAIALSRHYGLRGLKNADSTISNGALRAETPLVLSGNITLQAGAVKTAHNPDLSLAPALKASSVSPSTHTDICPECGVAALVHEEGCSKCYACGHAEC